MNQGERRDDPPQKESQAAPEMSQGGGDDAPLRIGGHAAKTLIGSGEQTGTSTLPLGHPLFGHSRCVRGILLHAVVQPWLFLLPSKSSYRIMPPVFSRYRTIHPCLEL